MNKKNRNDETASQFLYRHESIENMKNILSNLKISWEELTEEQTFQLYKRAYFVRKSFLLEIVLLLFIYFMSVYLLGLIFPLYNLDRFNLDMISFALFFLIMYINHKLIRYLMKLNLDNKIRIIEIENLKIKVANLENKGVKNEK